MGPVQWTTRSRMNMSWHCLLNGYVLPATNANRIDWNAMFYLNPFTNLEALRGVLDPVTVRLVAGYHLIWGLNQAVIRPSARWSWSDGSV